MASIFYNEPMIVGEELVSCLKHIGLGYEELKDCTIECFDAENFLKYWVIIRRSQEVDPVCNEVPLFSHVYILTTIEDDVVASADGYWINVKNLLFFDIFEDYAKQIDKNLLKKVLAGKELLAEKLGVSLKDKLSFEEIASSVEKIVKEKGIDCEDEYIFIGNKNDFSRVKKEEVAQGIYHADRKLLRRYIRTNLDIEDDSPIVENCGEGFAKTGDDLLAKIELA